MTFRKIVLKNWLTTIKAIIKLPSQLYKNMTLSGRSKVALELMLILLTLMSIIVYPNYLGTALHFPDEYQYYIYGNGNPQPIMPTLIAPNGTPPLVDGYYTPDDGWDETQHIKYRMGGDCTIAAKHDGQMLYILIMSEIEYKWITPTTLYFEQDIYSHDHNLDTGLINKMYNGTVGYNSDIFFKTHDGEGEKKSNGGKVRSNYSNDTWIQEWAIPLESGEHGGISVDKFPATLGFAITYGISSMFDWPSFKAYSHNPLTWGDLKILGNDNVVDNVQQFNINASYGKAPLINGHYNDFLYEWYETQEISVISGGVVYSIAAKHDYKNLYILLKWEGSSEWAHSMDIRFEQDGNTHDHNLSTGRDDIKFNGVGTSYGPNNLGDYHHNAVMWEEQNGRVVGDYSYGMWVQEWVIPINYDNPGDIYVNQTPTTLGFALIDWGSGVAIGVWPPGVSYNPETWGNMKLLPKN